MDGARTLFEGLETIVSRLGVPSETASTLFKHTEPGELLQNNFAAEARSIATSSSPSSVLPSLRVPGDDAGTRAKVKQALFTVPEGSTVSLGLQVQQVAAVMGAGVQVTDNHHVEGHLTISEALEALLLDVGHLTPVNGDAPLSVIQRVGKPSTSLEADGTNTLFSTAEETLSRIGAAGTDPPSGAGTLYQAAETLVRRVGEADSNPPSGAGTLYQAAETLVRRVGEADSNPPSGAGTLYEAAETIVRRVGEADSNAPSGAGTLYQAAETIVRRVGAPAAFPSNHPAQDQPAGHPAVDWTVNSALQQLVQQVGFPSRDVIDSGSGLASTVAASGIFRAVADTVQEGVLNAAVQQGSALDAALGPDDDRTLQGALAAVLTRLSAGVALTEPFKITQYLRKTLQDILVAIEELDFPNVSRLNTLRTVLTAHFVDHARALLQERRNAVDTAARAEAIEAMEALLQYVQQYCADAEYAQAVDASVATLPLGWALLQEGSDGIVLGTALPHQRTVVLGDAAQNITDVVVTQGVPGSPPIIAVLSNAALARVHLVAAVSPSSALSTRAVLCRSLFSSSASGGARLTTELTTLTTVVAPCNVGLGSIHSYTSTTVMQMHPVAQLLRGLQRELTFATSPLPLILRWHLLDTSFQIEADADLTVNNFSSALDAFSGNAVTVDDIVFFDLGTLSAGAAVTFPAPASTAPIVIVYCADASATFQPAVFERTVRGGVVILHSAAPLDIDITMLGGIVSVSGTFSGSLQGASVTSVLCHSSPVPSSTFTVTMADGEQIAVHSATLGNIPVVLPNSLVLQNSAGNNATLVSQLDSSVLYTAV